MRTVLLSCLVLCGCGRPTETTTGEVEQVTFAAGQTAVGTHLGGGGNGGLVVTSTDDEYFLLVKLPDGSREPVKVKKAVWSQAKIGDKIELYRSFGRWKPNY